MEITSEDLRRIIFSAALLESAQLDEFLNDAAERLSNKAKSISDENGKLLNKG